MKYSQTIERIEKDIAALQQDLVNTKNDVTRRTITASIKRMEAVKEDLIKKRKQSECSHPKTFSYNHGYHRICEECGAEV